MNKSGKGHVSGYGFLLEPRPLILMDSFRKQSITDNSFNMFRDHPWREKEEVASSRNLTAHSGCNARLMSA